MFERLPDQMEIEMGDLSEIDILPPRRTWIDFLPGKLKGYLRDKHRWPVYTKFELWVVYSWLLRVMANRLLKAASNQQKTFHHTVGVDYEPGKKGWN